jgi:hypothetical protein
MFGVLWFNDVPYEHSHTGVDDILLLKMAEFGTDKSGSFFRLEQFQHILGLLVYLWTMKSATITSDEPGGVVSIANWLWGQTVRDSNSGRRKKILSSLKPADRLWAPLSSVFNGNQVSLTGVKWPERDVDHLPPSITDIKNERRVYLLSLLCPPPHFGTLCTVTGNV